ncbi:MBL fold metallo-hydrolase [Acidisoma silvae]|uniref:MBL fold metallo-hydrolase n=1 Tax=Acidisoma silvae TaxID=2802396 RepID=A0A964E0W1_9PROT|nr:MBL fold metallo-hydrolase [Acidisoma silvae]MCB8877574.1 MBL fold metallo-hydrolase [Acidisoma silvae]
MTETSAQTPAFYKWMVGDIEAIALHDGWVAFDRPEGFVPGVSDDEVGEAYAAAGMARDKVTLTFTPMALRTAGKTVLIDTGFGESGPPTAGRLFGNLAAAGIKGEEVTDIVISHFHPDHVLGLFRKDGTAFYPKAQIHVPAKEWDFWMDDAKMAAAPEAAKGNFEMCRQVFGQIADAVKQYEWDAEILPGLTAVCAAGHTPGMSAIRITSGDESMIFVADITNNPLIFARHADWKLMFDMDGDATVATRKRILDQAVAEKTRVSFYHGSFPSTGFIVKGATGYEFLPAFWA